MYEVGGEGKRRKERISFTPLVCLKGSFICPPANHTVKKVNFLAFAVEKVKQQWYYEDANQHNTISAGGISTGALLGVRFFQPQPHCNPKR